MGNYKWCNNDSDTTLPYVVVLMISRNKDNSNIEGFKERRRSFFRTKDMEKIYRDFRHFVEDGVPGEMCRLYISVNKRDPKLVQKKLLHELIDNPISFDYIQAKIAGIAALKDCAAEKKWMFDYDSKDGIDDFLNDLFKYISCENAAVIDTVNGWHIIVKNGFDTRELLSKWNNVTLKRDDLYLEDWRTNVV